MTLQQAYQQLTLQLYDVYDNREAAAIANLVIEKVTGFTRLDRIVHKTFPLNEVQQQQLASFTTALLQGKPVQYVLREAWFAGMNLYVDENVLIPRPETEELVDWVMEQQRAFGRMGAGAAGMKNDLCVLDIGTGSGCIALALKKQLPDATVIACDVSATVLQVALANAAAQNLNVQFQQINILDQSQWQQLPAVDLIISNPPYITAGEQQEMHRNVIGYEPHLALFVSNDDPLEFYRQITAFAQLHLKENGWLYFEINEIYGKGITDLLVASGFDNAAIKKDLQGKDRMARGCKHH